MPENQPYQQLPAGSTQPLPRNLVTANGVVRCRFDLFVRWPDSAHRKINPFTHRGDCFGITEPDKMLGSLLRYFIRDHNKWLLSELYDNSFPLNNCDRLLLEYKEGRVVKNRLHHYEQLLQYFPLPSWLKS